MTAHDYPPACNGCGLEVPTDEDGLCKACAIFGAWFAGVESYGGGSQQTAQYTAKRIRLDLTEESE